MILPDVVWLAWLGAFAVIECYALVSRAQGDTLSERLRAWFRVKRPAGRFAFAATVVALAAWLIPHIIGG